MRRLHRIVRGFLLSLICLLALISFGYSYLLKSNPQAAELIDTGVAVVLPQSAPGASAYENATGKSYSPGKSKLSVEDFADPTQGKDYLEWKEDLQDPMSLLIAGTSIKAELLEALLSGEQSPELLREASALSSKDLAVFGQNARKLKESFSNKEVPDSLPKATQDMLRAAQGSAIELAAKALKLSQLGLAAQEGDFSALGGLSSLASQLGSAAERLDKNVSDAEKSLGVD